MHIYFSGIGGAAIGPLALIAKQAGYTVSGSDKQDSGYIQYLKNHGITDIHIGQSYEQIAHVHDNSPIDWFVYTSALPMENPHAPELAFCAEQAIKTSKRDELLNKILLDKQLKLIAIAGTHGKTTTTAMAIWLFKELGVPMSYSVGAKMSFGEMGAYDPASEYFVYEADEFDRNFLQFHPYTSIIAGIDYDHPDIYPTQEAYNQAFRDFLHQSQQVFAHPDDLHRLGLPGAPENIPLDRFSLAGEVNRKNAQLVVEAAQQLTGQPADTLIDIMNRFPGVSRRFEKITSSLYSDYAHTPEKIRGALQIAHEVAGDNVVVVYEGLHNTRQHFIRQELTNLFASIKKLYVVPSYLAREDTSLEMLTPEKLTRITAVPADRVPSALDETLRQAIATHMEQNDLVLCLSAGGGGSLDEWIRQEFTS